MTQNKIDCNSIAIIGISCRLPQSPTYATLWNNLIKEKNLLSYFTPEELIDYGLDINLVSNKDYIRVKGVLEGADLFDNSVFGITPRDAILMDPQQRIALECTWEALEDAGYNSELNSTSIGVFLGSNSGNYYLNNIFPNLTKSNQQEELSILTGNSNDYLATRISYLLNLTGPSITIQTACSTSLVAVHVACNNLLDYQCDIALAGGVSITLPLKSGYLHTKDGIYSSSGKCSTFSSNADGTVFSDGAGIVVLKRLKDAVKDRDNIYAVIKSSAINNDGKRKSGFTAPSIQGQAEVIALAYNNADVDPSTVQYIETHGTGTYVGDPIEILALTKAFQLYTKKLQFCAIGSIKTNLGHLVAAAGVAGLIKTILAMKNRTIPATLNFTTPNPNIEFEKTPFYVNNKTIKWPNFSSPLRAGISSFGIGGTNVHLVLEEAPSIKKISVEKKQYIIPLSANTTKSLNDYINKLSDYISNTRSDEHLSDIAFTLQVGRRALPFRKAITCENILELPIKLSLLTGSNNLLSPTYLNRSDYCIVFFFQDTIDFEKELSDYTIYLILDGIIDRFPDIIKKRVNDVLANNINTTSYFDNFIIQWALGYVLIKLGIIPDALVGNGLGNLVAATLSNSIDIIDSIEIVTALDNLSSNPNFTNNESDIIPVTKIYNIDKTPTLINPNQTSFRNDNKLEAWYTLIFNTKNENSEEILKKITNLHTNVILTNFAKQNIIEHYANVQFTHVVNILYNSFFATIAFFWELGINIDWQMLNNNVLYNRLSLPTYQFDRSRFWIDSNTNHLPNYYNTKLENVIGPNNLNSYFSLDIIIEKIIAVLWNDIFKLITIKKEEDFFFLGGDSVSALEIIGKINYLFKIELNLADFFNNSSLENLTKIVINKIQCR